MPSQVSPDRWMVEEPVYPNYTGNTRLLILLRLNSGEMDIMLHRGNFADGLMD
jgi:hypothetical protein